MAEKQPADDFATRIKRDDHFGAQAIERPTQEWPLILRGNMREVGAGKEMPMQFKPADQWVTFVVLDLVSFRQTTQSRTQAITMPLLNKRKNSNPGHAGSIRH